MRILPPAWCWVITMGVTMEWAFLFWFCYAGKLYGWCVYVLLVGRVATRSFRLWHVVCGRQMRGISLIMAGLRFSFDACALLSYSQSESGLGVL